MKKPCLASGAFLGILFHSASLWAWNGTDHIAITRLALEEAAPDWQLDQPVEIHPLQSLLDKLKVIRPALGDPRQWAHYLQINTKTDFDYLPPEAKGQKELSALSILSFFSVDPDDGRDQDLPELSPDQKWFGSPRGGNSQAFRHIEKPPFDWRHPSGTFGFPLRAVGEATKRAEIYFQASLLAFSLQEDYWGWRLLAGTFHYLQDLHQPYHAGQITPGLLTRGLWAFLRWGYDEKGIMGTFAHIISNSHRFYESYVAIPSGHDNGVKGEALKALKGRDLAPITGTIRDLAIQVRDSSNRHFPELVCAVTRASDPVLFSSYDFKSDQKGADNPSRFLKTGPEFEESNQKIFEITRERFESAGRVIRAVVHAAIENQRAEKPETLLRNLDLLLNEPVRQEPF